MTNFELMIRKEDIENLYRLVAKRIVDEMSLEYRKTLNDYYPCNNNNFYYCYEDAINAEIEWLKEELEL